MARYGRLTNSVVVERQQLGAGETAVSITVRLTSGQNSFVVAANDLAGNLSSPIVVPTITYTPASTSNDSSTGGGSGNKSGGGGKSPSTGVTIVQGGAGGGGPSPAPVPIAPAAPVVPAHAQRKTSSGACLGCLCCRRLHSVDCAEPCHAQWNHRRHAGRHARQR